MSFIWGRFEMPWGIVCNYGCRLEADETDYSVEEYANPELKLITAQFSDADVYGAVTREITGENAVGPYHLVIQIQDCEALGIYEGDGDHKFVAEILLVSPYKAPKALHEYIRDNEIPENELSDLDRAIILVEADKVAHLWQAAADDPDVLKAEAIKRLPKVHYLIQDYLDQPQNQMGETGWDRMEDRE